jgi:hypothetical protein
MDNKNTHQTLISQTKKPDITKNISIVEEAKKLGGVIVKEYTYEKQQ